MIIILTHNNLIESSKGKDLKDIKQSDLSIASNIYEESVLVVYADKDSYKILKNRYGYCNIINKEILNKLIENIVFILR